MPVFNSIPMEHAPPKYDAVVVGSGPNGLAAAITLAREGRRVAVLESRDRIGGGARSAEVTLPGFVHDLCSAIHPMAAGSPFFRTVPLAEHGVKWIHSPSLLAHPLADGSAVMLERSVAATAENLGGDARSYRRLIEPLVGNWDSLAPEILAPIHFPRHPFSMARFGLQALRSCAGLTNGRFKTSRGRALFAGLCAHSVLPLESLASAAFGLVLAMFGHAVGWPLIEGGTQKLSDGLAAFLRSLGGETRENARVPSLRELPESRGCHARRDAAPIQCPLRRPSQLPAQPNGKIPVRAGGL